MSAAGATGLHVRGGRPLRGALTLPPDLDVAQRALVFGALAGGRCQLPCDAAVARALEPALGVWRALGASCAFADGAIVIDGATPDGLRMPSGALDCGRSLSALALCAGVLCAQRFGTRVSVDASLSERALVGLVEPLRARGAHIAGRGERATAPLAVAPLVEGERLLPIDCALQRADALTKGAVLMSGLFASGPTTVWEPCVSADHTERAMVALGLPLRRIGTALALDVGAWDRTLTMPEMLALPGSPSIALCLAVAAHLVPGSAIALAGAGINPSRAGALDLLRSWSGGLTIEPEGDAGLREPIAQLRVRSGAVRGGALGGELLVRARDELPLIAALAAGARRPVHAYDLDWLGDDASAPLPGLSAVLEAFGLRVERGVNELRVAARQGQGARLQAAYVDALDDPQLALCACALALACPGESVVEHAAQALDLAYPGLVEAARALGADLEYL